MRFVTQAFGKLRQFVPCSVAAAIGIAVAATAFGVMIVRDDNDAKTQFNVLAENHFMVLQNGLNEYVNRLKVVRALFDSSVDPVSRGEFEAFTQPLLRENAAIATLSWVPRVTGPDRAAYERMAVMQGIPDFHFKIMSDAGKMTAAPERGVYYPIFYATVPKTSPLYGLDLGSEPATLAELERARDLDRLGFSPAPKLVSSGGVHGGFLFSLPIYKHGSPHATIEDRQRNLAGFVHGSVITAEMVDTIIKDNKTPKGLDLFFYLPYSGWQAMPAYIHPSRLRTSPLVPMSEAEAAKGRYWSRDLSADGQPWLMMVARPMPGGPLTVHHERAWFVFSFGLILTAAVVIYIRSSRRHALRMMHANQKVSDLAQTDVLTSLANRRAFVERLRGAFAACRRGAMPFAVLYFDLDHFKDVNDTLGHGIGDELLRQVAARVRATVRETDVIARFGGDEFAILQSDVEDLEAGGALAGKLGKILAEPYPIEGNEVHVTASIGIARYSPDVVAPDTMMIQADLALYRAKEDGRNCFRFHTADLDRHIQERVVLADDLRGAVDRNELELHYQPQVDLRSGRIVGLEALLRWNHPKRGRISPSVFIPVAERSGQIQALGQWVLDAACRQLRLWRDAGIAPELVGVNFSALHFKGSAELDREVAASFDKWGIPPDRIEIELTESVLMDITQQHDDRFQRLRRLGVRIAVDDFGTGYSSLSYLANYPINRVKIAQELVSGVDTDPRSATVVRAAIRLAHELGIEIIAEGVETEGQEKFLLSSGCEHGQGFYFSRPVDAEQAAALLRSGKITPARRPLRLVENSAA
ncbi:MAG: EAL domain-containing protein [Xanthobacteraceae bacterium]